jgi:hypothetical protein
VPLPALWLLSWGHPTALVAAWNLRPAAGWPAGFYQAGEGFGLWVVVLPELPKTRETLPLRLFGDERMRQGLPREIASLGPGDPMGPAVVGMLKTWTLWVRGQPQDENTRRWLMDFDQVVQAEIRKIQDKGKGEGLRVAVRDLCEVLGIALTPEQQAHIDALDLAGLGALRLALKQHRAWPTEG